MANLQLDKTLKIENAVYDINAVYSDEAGQTTKSLTVKESGADNTTVFTFNGSASREINYVHADKGGKFNNEVLIDNKYSDITEAPDHAIINFSQVKQLVHDLNASPLYTWQDSQLESFISAHSTMYGLNTVVGTADDFETFKRIMGVPDLASTDEETRYYGLSVASANQATEGSVGYRTKTNSTYKDVYLPSYGYYNELSTGIIDLSKGVPVTTIREKAFENNKTIEKVMIPESITTIESYAFRYCSAIKSIKLPSQLERISTETFNGCTSLKSVVIGKKVKKISRDAFNLCSNLKTVYYEGTEDDWLAFNIVDTVTLSDDIKQISSKGNTALTDVYTKSKNGVEGYDFIFNYKYTPDFQELPCLYICTDTETDALNKMFLKMPNTGIFMELAQGATRLESQIGAAAQGHYTYETLAAIIAGINARLDGLGVKTLPTTLPETESVIIPENLHTEILADDFSTNEVPTVSDLTEAIVKSYGNTTWNANNITSSLSNALTHMSGNNGDSVQKLRNDLTDLAKEVEFDLGGAEDQLGTAIDVSNTRIDKIISGEQTVGKTQGTLTINGQGFDGSTDMTIGTTDADIKLSADLYTNYNIGRITGASESNKVLIGRKDQTLRKMFENIFTAQAEVPTITLPSLSLSLSNNSSSIEYGNTVTFTATVTANTGRLNSSYYSGGYTTDTGVSWGTLNLVSTNSTFTSKTSGITSGTSFTFTPSTTYYAVASGGTIKGKATAPSGYTSSGKVAKNNLGNDTDVKISSSTSAKESSEASTSVSAGYVPYTYVLSASLPTSLPTSNRSKNKPSSITVSGGNANTYLYIFVPSSASISTIKSGGFGVPFTCVETSKSYAVNNSKSTTFKVYKTDSTVVSNTFDIT